MSTHAGTTRQRSGSSGNGSTKSAKSPAERIASLEAQIQRTRDQIEDHRAKEQAAFLEYRAARERHRSGHNESRPYDEHSMARMAAERRLASLERQLTNAREEAAGRDRALDRHNAQVAKLEARLAETQRQLAEARAARDAHVAARARGETPAATPRSTSSGTRGRRQAPTIELLRPTGNVDLSRLRPGGNIDPFALYEGYGEAQSRRVLIEQAMDELRGSAAFVARRYPDSRPAGRSKAALVDYIMEHVMRGEQP